MTPEEKLKQIRANLQKGEETRSDEAMHTDNTGNGKEFVPSDLASQVINSIRNSDTFMSKLSAPIVMPTPIYTLPIEGWDPTRYATNEQGDVPANAVTTSKAGTGAITLTAKKYSTSVYASSELDEDSIVNIKSYLAEKFSKSYIELLDNIRYNGDTETGATGNVNSDDWAPTAGSYFLHQDGLVKRAIANTKTLNVGSLSLSTIRSMRQMMWLKGAKPSELILVPTLDVYYNMLNMTQAETMEKFWGRATVTNGVLTAIDGIEVMPTSLLANAEADGKISTTPANNVKGRILLVYKPDLMHGFRRNLNIYTEFLPHLDQFRFTGHFRYATQVKDTDNTVLGINVTV